MPVATTKWPPAGAPFSGHGKGKQHRRALRQEIGDRRRTWRGHFHIGAAGEFGGTPEIGHLLPGIGDGKEAVAGLGALGIGGTVGGEELIERRRIGGTVGRAQFAAVLMVAENRGQGRN